jgi:lambda repressor-like predicted transcriptional regulator
MARSKEDNETILDMGAILNEALQDETFKGRRLTKTQQIREQRGKIAELRKRGYTLVDIAKMVEVSKDTLRQALLVPKKTKKIAAQTDAEKQPQGANEKKSEAKTEPSTAPVVSSPPKPIMKPNDFAGIRRLNARK